MISGHRLGKMLKRSIRKFMSLRFKRLHILQRDVWYWKVRIILASDWVKRRKYYLADMDLQETNCPELSEKTANAIDDPNLHQLFVSTQMNNPDLCIKSALQ